MELTEAERAARTQKWKEIARRATEELRAAGATDVLVHAKDEQRAIVAGEASLDAMFVFHRNLMKTGGSMISKEPSRLPPELAALLEALKVL